MCLSWAPRSFPFGFVEVFPTLVRFSQINHVRTASNVVLACIPSGVAFFFPPQGPPLPVLPTLFFTRDLCTMQFFWRPFDPPGSS